MATRTTKTRKSNTPSNSDGIITQTIHSSRQAGPTQIRILLPDRFDRAGRHVVVYVLPVEPMNETRYGDGLLEMKRLDLHNRCQAICIAPTFTHLPWYADHPRKAKIRQESYFLRVVLPRVERKYGAGDRYLLGFSKSGWGAFSLLLRHPHLFTGAAAWDAPLMMPKPNKFQMRGIFGTQANFERYQISKLLEQHASEPRPNNRLVLLGRGNFAHDVRQAHQLMMKLKIAHEYRDGPSQPHHWCSGWLAQAVSLLLSPATPSRTKKNG